MSLTNMYCFTHEGKEEEEEQSKICRLIPSLIKEACSHCNVSSCLKSSASLSSDNEEDESLSNSDLDNKNVIILEIRNSAMKAKTRPKDCLFADNLHWVFSPTTKKLQIAPKEGIDESEDGGGENDDDRSEVFHSVKSCFSRCSSDKEYMDCLKEFRGRSIWEEFLHCEGWPFGLCRKALMLPPMPSSPSDSWTWSKRNLGTKNCASA